MDKSKLTGFVGSGVAVIMLLLASFSSTWLIGNNYGIRSEVGLRSVDICDEGGDCERVSLSEWAESPYAPDGLSTYIR